MIDVSVREEFRDFARGLSRAEREQLPFAFARALTRVGREAGEEATRSLPSRIESPTPFTLRAFAVRGATKRRLEAVVFARPIQARYLSLLETGGRREPKGRAVVNPAGAGVNRYGNIPRGQVRRLLAGKNTFAGTVRGVSGIWRRRGSGLRLMIRFDEGNDVEPVLGFADTVRGVVRRRLPAVAAEELRRALATARPRGPRA